MPLFNGAAVTVDPQPLVFHIAPDHIDPSLIDRAAQALRDGKLVAFPTETVYGLGCNALDEHAIAKVFQAKGRPSSDPLIVHVDGLAMAETVIDGPLPPAATALAKAFWPGPLTMVLPRGDVVPYAVTSGPESHENPTYSPDGRRIAFALQRGRESQIYVMDADGGNWKQLPVLMLVGLYSLITWVMAIYLWLYDLSVCVDGLQHPYSVGRRV